MKTAFDLKQHASWIFNTFADLYKYPDFGIWKDISTGHLLTVLNKRIAVLTKAESMIEITDIPASLEQMKKVYIDLLINTAIPVESVYKQWTIDPSCNLPFAKSKGYLMGDSALHILFLLDSLNMEIPEEVGGRPDHLAVLLELLSFFIENGQPEITVQFIKDHFDWLDEFASKLESVSDGEFYLQITLLLQQALDSIKQLNMFEAIPAN